jgi:VanZ family protein
MPIDHTLKVRVILLIAVSVTLSILFLSLIRLDDLPDLEVKQMDKYYHTFAYFVLTLSWIAYFKIRNKKLKINFLFYIVIGLILFGIVIEVLQRALTDYRLLDYQDMIANTIGVILATTLFIPVRNKAF